jgi:hypothetical protein
MMHHGNALYRTSFRKPDQGCMRKNPLLFLPFLPKEAETSPTTSGIFPQKTGYNSGTTTQPAASMRGNSA